MWVPLGLVEFLADILDSGFGVHLTFPISFTSLRVVNAQEREIARWEHRSPRPQTYYLLVIRG